MAWLIFMDWVEVETLDPTFDSLSLSSTTLVMRALVWGVYSCCFPDLLGHDQDMCPGS